MLKQQQNTLKHNANAHQKLGEDVGKLFHSDDAKKEATKKPRVKSKQEREDDKLISQQQMMLKQQQKAIARTKDAKDDLGESSESKGEEMASLFKDKSNDDKNVKVAEKKHSNKVDQ